MSAEKFTEEDNQKMVEMVFYKQYFRFRDHDQVKSAISSAIHHQHTRSMIISILTALVYVNLISSWKQAQPAGMVAEIMAFALLWMSFFRLNSRSTVVCKLERDKLSSIVDKLNVFIAAALVLTGHEMVISIFMMLTTGCNELFWFDVKQKRTEYEQSLKDASLSTPV